MTTDSHRRETKNFTSERNASNDARQQGAIAAGLLPSYVEAVKARAIELYCAGRIDEAKALIAREFAK